MPLYIPMWVMAILAALITTLATTFIVRHRKQIASFFVNVFRTVRYEWTINRNRWIRPILANTLGIAVAVASHLLLKPGVLQVVFSWTFPLIWAVILFNGISVRRKRRKQATLEAAQRAEANQETQRREQEKQDTAARRKAQAKWFRDLGLLNPNTEDLGCYFYIWYLDPQGMLCKLSVEDFKKFVTVQKSLQQPLPTACVYMSHEGDWNEVGSLCWSLHRRPTHLLVGIIDHRGHRLPVTFEEGSTNEQRAIEVLRIIGQFHSFEHYVLDYRAQQAAALVQGMKRATQSPALAQARLLLQADYHSEFTTTHRPLLIESAQRVVA